MPFSIILNRIWHNRYILLVLLVALCLITGFFALGPLYLRAVAQSGLVYRVEHAQPGEFNLVLQSPIRIQGESQPILDRHLGKLVRQVEWITKSEGIFCDHTVPAVSCIEPGIRHGYLPIGFSRFKERFELIEGRWPETLPADSAVPLEAVLSSTVAETAKLTVGSQINLRGANDHDIKVAIVGLVEPRELQDPFWISLKIVTQGQLTDIDVNNQRFDFGVIIPEAAYDSVIASNVLSRNVYQWYVATDTDLLRAESLDNLNATLHQMEADFRLQYSDISVLGDLTTNITQFLEKVAIAEGTVFLISATTLVLLLYQLMMIMSLILERQSKEWSVITSRGGSTLQITVTQFVTVVLPGIIAGLGGPLFAQVMLWGLQQVGPSSGILGTVSVSALTIPPTSVLLSTAAAVISVITLVLPALPLASRSILLLKQSVSRPPLHPVWAQYYLDFILLFIGACFLLRMYVIAGGEGLGGFLQEPASFIRLIVTAQNAELLNDPFNLAGAALLITGFALLWVRVFPLIMRLSGVILGGLNGLVAPFALWNIEREPGHYAQLVLLLIGTLAIGTASLALAATHDSASWTSALKLNGAEGRVILNPSEVNPDTDMTGLAGVTGNVAVMHYVSTSGVGEQTVTLYGIDPPAFIGMHPEMDAVISPLAEEKPIAASGVVLPVDTTAITLEVEAAPLEAGQTIQTRIELQLVDSIGVAHHISMTTSDETVTGRFVTYKAMFPDNVPFSPWYFTGIRIPSIVEGQSQFQAQLFLDNLTAVNASGEATIIQDFESPVLTEWTAKSQQSGTGLFGIPTSAQAATGLYSFRVDYTVVRRGGQFVYPFIAVNVQPTGEIPVVVSPAFAKYYGERGDARRPLQIDDRGSFSFPLPEGEVDLSYRVVGITADWYSANQRDLIVITRSDILRLFLNTIGKPDDFFNTNEMWFATQERQPGVALQQAAASLRGVTQVTFAWDLYEQIRREPLPNAITGTLVTVFWLSLVLCLLDFAFYLSMTAQRRAISFAALRAMGWNTHKLWAVLSVEQLILVVPALVIGIGLGWLTAYLLLPLLALITQIEPVFPLLTVGAMASVLLVVFAFLLIGVAFILQRMSVTQVLRLGEE